MGKNLYRVEGGYETGEYKKTKSLTFIDLVKKAFIVNNSCFDFSAASFFFSLLFAILDTNSLVCRLLTFTNLLFILCSSSFKTASIVSTFSYSIIAYAF